ncbi:PREDICTED: uncharacterized protein LOC104586526 [Nelumbo nucifera]|uniref:Uncharacterized protein LOC104586526 n=1 Tax=Nelumbo nucifera TaxID=4432 RepID=A0A1U7YW12_NELNU|nr:PREDICTED: uncharacterized protein LOC104586526 [Nelumbo nucifera]
MAQIRDIDNLLPTKNGQVEATNKTLLRMLSKTMADNQKDWSEKMLETLWAYRTTIRKSTQALPYSLVYGQEVVLPAEIRVVFARISFAMGIKIRHEDINHLVADKLEAIDED